MPPNVRGRGFEAPDFLERGIHFRERGIIFRTHESFAIQFCKQPFEIFKERSLLKIRFNALTSKLLYSCCVLGCRAGVFWRKPRALTPPSWINKRAESGTSP